MTQRERKMAVTVGASAAVFVTLYVGYSFWDAITEHDGAIANLKTQIEASEAKIKTVIDGRPVLNHHWKQMKAEASRRECRQERVPEVSRWFD